MSTTKSHVFQQALAATARVACAVALVGCGPGYAELTDSQDSGPAPQECDVASLDAQVAAGDSNRQIADCCESVEGQPEWDLVDGLTRVACCDALDWDWESFPGCTPWGPPRPPSLVRGLAGLGTAQAVRRAALAHVA